MINLSPVRISSSLSRGFIRWMGTCLRFGKSATWLNSLATILVWVTWPTNWELGERGSGTAEHFGVCDRIDLAMGTFSKAFGVTGGFIAGKKEVIDYLRYFSNSYMFSAHLPQAVVAADSAGIDVIEKQPELRAKLHSNVKTMVRRLNEIGYRVETESAIIPVLLPATVDIRALGRRFHEEGLFANLIEYPAVPKDAQRIRLSVMADHTEQDLSFAVVWLPEAWPRVWADLGPQPFSRSINPNFLPGREKLSR